MRWPEVRAVDWSKFPGAYGTKRDVAHALEVLRFGKDAEDDDFSDAWLDVLCGHVWHQGTVYPVTAPVLPFVFDVVERSPALAENGEVREAVAMFFAHCAASADAEAQGVHDVLVAHEARLGRWLGTELGDAALIALLCVPALAERTLCVVDRKALLHAALEEPALVPRSARELAADELAKNPHLITQRAAALLRSGDAQALDLGKNLLQAVQTALLRGDGAFAELDERFALKKREQRFDAPGETEATVIVSERDWFIAKTTRNVMVRWSGHPFMESEKVILVDIDSRNIPREVRGMGEHASVRATFDETDRLHRRR